MYYSALSFITMWVGMAVFPIHSSFLFIQCHLAWWIHYTLCVNPLSALYNIIAMRVPVTQRK